MGEHEVKLKALKASELGFDLFESRAIADQVQFKVGRVLASRWSKRLGNSWRRRRGFHFEITRRRRRQVPRRAW